MVYFQCETCGETIKKKQIKPHYSFQCKSAHSFSCLTCYKHFDRESIVEHTSCITEEEKYNKGDEKFQQNKQAMKNKQMKVVDNTDEIDFSQFKWEGVKKTVVKILGKLNTKKITIERLVKELALIYSKHKEVEISEVDNEQVRKNLMEKIEDYDKLIIDLGKNTIRLK